MASNSQYSKSIVCLTHARFVDEWEKGNIPSDPVIIIDEALSCFEGYELTPEKRKNIMRALPLSPDNEAKIETQRHWDSIIALCADNGCHCDDTHYPSEWRSYIARLIAAVRNDPSSRRTQKEIDDLIEYMRFFGLKTGNTYVMKDGGNYRFVRERVLMDLPNQMIILDGSAMLSNTKWNGFSIYRSDRGLPSYHNLTLHAVTGNPTMTKLAKKIGNLKRAFNRRISLNADNRILVLANKNLDDKTGMKEVADYVTALKDKGATIIECGSIIGNNAGRECTMAILALSVFTTVPDYVLATAVRTGSEVPATRIWTNLKQPRMHLGGFADPDIDLTFRRHYANLLYQYILRGAVRVNPEAEYHVYSLVAGTGILCELERWIPGYRLRVEEPPTSANLEIHGLSRLKRNGFGAATSYRRLCRAMGYASKNPAILDKARHILAALHTEKRVGTL